MKRKNIKDVGLMAVGLMLFFASNISYILLAFAFRDFSFPLMLMYLLTVPALILSVYIMNESARENKTRIKPMAFSQKIAVVSRELGELN
jgi:uncharacterized integral membrane protein